MTLSANIDYMWRIQSRGTSDGGLVVGSIITQMLSLRQLLFCQAMHDPQCQHQ